MKRLLGLFLLILVSVWIGIQLNKDPGYLLITINHWTVETTVWFAVLAIAALFTVIYLVLRLFNGLGLMRFRWHKWRQKRASKKAQTKTRKGLIEFSEGYWEQAENHLIKALPNTDAPLINYLAAARAAQEQGNSKQRDKYLREAQQSMPEAKVAVELTQAQLQISDHQWEQALATLKHLHSLAPKHPYVLKLLLRLYKEIKDYQAIIELLPVLRKNKIISRNELSELELWCYQGLLETKAKSCDIKAVCDFYQQLPKHVAQSPQVIISYVQLLLAENEFSQAEALLKVSMKKQWSEDLVELYGLAVNDVKKQLAFCEGLQKHHPNSAKLYLTLGRLAIANQLWGKAKSYLEKSIELAPSSSAYAELGKLLEHLNEVEEAKDYYKQGLLLALE